MLLRLLREHTRQYRWLILTICLLQAVLVVAALWLPTLNAEIIDNGVAKGDTGYIIRTGILMLGASLLQAAFSIAAIYLSSKTAMGLGRDIRTRIFSHVQTFSEQEVTYFGAPSLITRNTNDVQQVQMLVQMGLAMIVQAPVMLVGGVIMSMRQDLPLSAWLLVLVPAMVGLIGVLVIKAAPHFRAMQVKIDRINGVMREQITGVRVVRAFVREKFEIARFTAASNDLFTTQVKVGTLMAFTLPAVFLVGNLASVGVLWFGGQRIASGAMQVGALTAFITYIMLILTSVLIAAMMFFMLPRAQVSAERIVEVLDTATSVVPPAAPATQAPRDGTVTFTKVGFTYPGASKPVLWDVNFCAEAGKTTAIIGATGAGKTTLINLVPRLFDATNGTVTIGGSDVRDLSASQLAAEVALVPQKAYLFSGTIASNLRYGNPDATDAQLWQALQIAQVAEFVRAYEGGLDGQVAQGGTNFSGGQRQRLAIARALVAKGKVLLFDDSFSALDYATDAALRRALRAEVTQAAIIVVAQRVTSIKTADRIYVLDAGRVVACGTHTQLLEACATYREIVASQLTEQEAR